MKLYEYDEAIKKCLGKVDEETGELLDFDAELFEQLNIEKEKKIEGICCWQKELVAEAKAIREEEKVLAERRRVLENKADSIVEFLRTYLQGNKFETPKVKCSYRSVTSCEIFDEIKCLDWLMSNGKDDAYKHVLTPNKTEIKKILAEEEIPGAVLVTKQSLSIK